MAGERCPRCGAAFHCGIDDAEPCACTTLELDAGVQQRLRERYTGCLCMTCLRELGGRRAEVAVPAPPRP
jgi:ribosomal protein L34E